MSTRFSGGCSAPPDNALVRPMIPSCEALDFLLLPGLGNSGVDHWQSHWSMAFPNASRVLQDDWDTPRLPDWLARLDNAVAQGMRPAVLIAHSLGVALAVQWLATRAPGRVKAALLVAPSDVESADHTPNEVRNFAPLPRAALPVPFDRDRQQQRSLCDSCARRRLRRKLEVRLLRCRRTRPSQRRVPPRAVAAGTGAARAAAQPGLKSGYPYFAPPPTIRATTPSRLTKR